jgi:hypothetical protein
MGGDGATAAMHGAQPVLAARGLVKALEHAGFSAG